MFKYYKRDGTLYNSAEEYMKDYSDADKRILKQETLPNGLFISTVWTGVDIEYSPCQKEPLIFETMVFPKEGVWQEIDAKRYPTEEEALDGHKEMVVKWKKEVK